jgi:hypothetical protein
MKGNQKSIVAGVAVFVLAVAFYMLVLSPKRAEVSELDSQVTSLEAEVSEQEQMVAFGEQARKEFPRDYGRLVVLGKAVPDAADTASLMVQLNGIADRTNTSFRGIALAEGTGAGEGTTSTPAPTAPAPPAEGGETAAPPAEGATAPGSTTTATAPAAAPAPATEESAANLPIGATVGTAGLPTLPYTLTFTGGFFGIADYIGQLDALVQFNGQNGPVQVDGRLMTIDGFALKGGEPGSNPILDASFALTSYVTPSTQGLTAGASPGGPAAGGVQATPASATVAP